MPNEVLRKLADDLKAERESKNISLQQVANKTKIDIKFLRAIEDAKFDILPDVYIRAFLKEYASTIDLSPNDILYKYESALMGKSDDKPVQVEKENIDLSGQPNLVAADSIISSEPKIKKQGAFNFNYSLIAVVVFVVLILVYFLFLKEQIPEIVADQNYSGDNTTSANNTPAFEIDSSKSAMAPVRQASNDSLKLSLNISQRVWIKVLSDKNLRFQGMVDGNSKLSYNADKEFRVVVGNAGSVNITLNGKQLSNIGKAGEIRNLVINADTVKAFTIVQPAKNETKPPIKN